MDIPESRALETLDAGVVEPGDLQVETLLRLNVCLAFAENERGRKLRRIFDDRMAEPVKSGELKLLYPKRGVRCPF